MPVPQNLGQLCRWPHLRYPIAEWSSHRHAAALPAVNYSSHLSPPPFPSAISPQSCTADHWKVLILKFTQTPNTLGTIVLVFMQQQNHFMQKSPKTSHCAQDTQKVRNVYHYCEVLLFFSTKQHIYTSQYQYICYKKHPFKIRPLSKKKTHRGCEQYTILAREPFMKIIKMCTAHT